MIERFGAGWAVDAAIVGVTFNRAGKIAAYAAGDGVVQLHGPGVGEPKLVTAHPDAGALVVAQDVTEGGFLTGGDDGRLVRIGADGSAQEVVGFGGAWVEHVASHDESGLIVAGVGKKAHLLSPKGQRAVEHASTVGGVAIAPNGKRLAVAHYGGVSLWWTGSEGPPRVLVWKGSHIAITWSPDGKYVVTATQDRELHGWRLADSQDMRMSGYAGKANSLSWCDKPASLATSGADVAVIWPFAGKDGPMGKPPVELGGGNQVLVTQVAFDPAAASIVLGFDDGTIERVILSDGNRQTIRAAGGGRVVALAWSPDGRFLAFGGENGACGLVDIAAADAG